jgi:hypothetical protein
MYKKLPYFLVPLLILIFYLRIFSTIKIKSDTYDELKCLKAGEYLSKGAGWVVEASVFHPPLSYYIHGYLLKGRFFKNTDEQIFYARLMMAVFAVLFGFFIFKYAEEKSGAPAASAPLQERFDLLLELFLIAAAHVLFLDHAQLVHQI